jgi:hypothetical protein
LGAKPGATECGGMMSVRGYGGAKSDWPLRDVDPQSVISAGSQRCGRCKNQVEDTKVMRVGSKDW